MTTEQTTLQRLKEVCEAENGLDPDILCYSPEYLEVACTALPALIEYCESLEQLAALVEPVKEFVYLVKTQYSAATAAVEAARARLEEVCPKK